jgi:YihY family inner membrane protein
MVPLVSRLDRMQRRRPAVGVPVAVVYKYLDDQGAYLAAILTYYSFLAIFPLMLIAATVLGFILQGNQQLQQELLNTALSRFPIVGDQLGRPEGLHGSITAVLVGTLAALYGALGLGQAAQNALSVSWAIPRNSRLNPVASRLRSLVLLTFAGIAVLALALSATLLSHLEIIGAQLSGWLNVAVTLLSAVFVAVVLGVILAVGTSVRHRFREVLPGAVFIAVLWQALQSLGGLYVARVIQKVSAMNGVFALVLGLFAFLFLAATIAVLGFEVNAVLGKRLYPRALLTPFTDAVELTAADRQVYTEFAQAQRQKGFERVSVSFDGHRSPEPAPSPAEPVLPEPRVPKE